MAATARIVDRGKAAMQTSDTQKASPDRPTREKIFAAAGWYDPDSVTFAETTDQPVEWTAEAPATSRPETAERVPVLEPA